MPIYSRYKNLRRTREIANVFIKHGFGYIIDRTGLFDYLPLKRIKDDRIDAKLPVGLRVRKTLEELGPTFIKLGQMLSTRKDLLPEDILEELEKLQDEVKPFGSQEARQIISEELGKPPGEIFDSLSEEPIAAASIGQVYKATLKNGREAIVKVKRPDIEKIVEKDLEILLDLAGFLEHRTEWARTYGIVDMVEEFADTLRREMDFAREGRNAERLRKYFAGSREIYIPEVFWEWTTSKVLTMEYLEGVKISEVNAALEYDFDRKNIAETLVRSYFKQILQFGFFHADPHPGNILVLKDGRIGFLDFGMVGVLSDEMKALGTRLVFAVIRKDVDAVADALLEMGIAQKKVNVDELKKDISRMILKYYDAPIEEIRIGETMTLMLQLARKYQVKVPSEIVILAKTLITLEGILAALAPDVNMVELARPYVNEILRETYSIKGLKNGIARSIEKLKDYGWGLPRHSLKVLEMLERGELELILKHEKLDRLISRLDIISNRLAFSIIVASLIIGSSMMANQSRRLFMKIPLAELGFVIAGFLGFWLLISIMRSGRL
ncbi:ABC1 kinase family protein [Thermoanaerobacterium sp. DL9XJH110]|uniref:ABC1 kinase family protein n=1 Tax=Thermoanaerobacterium sp. DL9XJH110 TaxID=3386643 RepID=UPI003BB54DAC